jgi:transcription elongation factor GreA
MQKNVMTVEGEAALRVELENLKKNDRPNVIAAIAEAREHGDLKENAEYHAAREQQGFIEGRIQDIEAKLSNSQIIDIAKIPQGDRIIFGSRVTILNVETDEQVTYRIVGDDEANVKEGKISYQSPIARALISKEIGDVVVVKTPGGDVEYEIDDVVYSAT